MVKVTSQLPMPVNQFVVERECKHLVKFFAQALHGDLSVDSHIIFSYHKDISYLYSRINSII